MENDFEQGWGRGLEQLVAQVKLGKYHESGMEYMKTWFALFRGINVGGNNKLPMKELVSVLESLGLKNIRTWIQSGNVVFDGKGESVALAAKMSAAIKKSHGFEPRVLLLDAARLEQAISANPFPEGEAEGNTLHSIFSNLSRPNPICQRWKRSARPANNMN